MSKLSDWMFVPQEDKPFVHFESSIDNPNVVSGYVPVRSTIDAMRGGERLMADQMFDGFDHTQYKDEVEQRWGAEAYARSDAWWRGMSADERTAWQRRVADLQREWVAAAESGGCVCHDRELTGRAGGRSRLRAIAAAAGRDGRSAGGAP